VSAAGRPVFVDASIFIGAGFNMESRDLRMLEALVENETLSIVTTDIVTREVHSHITKDMKVAKAAHERFRKDSRVLTAVDTSRGLREQFDEAKVEKAVHDAFDDFLKRTQAVIITVDKLEVSLVLEAYFAHTPPFGDGEKRKEFPDALSIAALRQWCSAKKIKELAFVTGDSLLLQAAESIENVETFEALRSLFDEVYDDARTDFVKRQLIKRKKEIAKRITEQFSDRGFYVSDHFEGEVTEVTVTDVDLSDDEDLYDIVDLDEDSATVSVFVDVEYRAELTYGDENLASYDSEDKTVTFWGNIEESVKRTENVEVQIEVSLDGIDADAFDIEDVSMGLDTVFIETDADLEWKKGYK
jgi:hypothetical protein